MSFIDEEILSCFLDEALDALEEWERACMDLEGDPESDGLNSLFRAAHNLKGASRAVGLEEFGQFVHIVENVINLIRNGELKVESVIIELFLNSQNKLTEWVNNLRNSPEYVEDVAELTTTLSDYMENGGAQEQSIEEFPEIDDSEELSEEDLDALFWAAKEEVENQRLENEIVQVEKPASTPAPKTDNSDSKGDEKDKQIFHANETIRISAQKLDELIQIIGELSIHQSIVYEGRRTNTLDSLPCQNAIDLSSKMTKELHTKALSLRMHPVDRLFQRLERVARDVARAQKKDIHIEIYGTEVELDKTVIEKVTDPLIHIVRNSVDHGIEDKEERAETGKTEVATLVFKAVQDSAGVIINIIDDGRGIDPKRIKNKAVEVGMLEGDEVISPEQLYKMMFLPGFSTAKVVTDISGRGVGLDVVMKAVESLKGTIDVTSNLGQGSTFSICLPTSLSILDALVVEIDEYRYAVPMQDLVEIIDLTTFAVESSGGKKGKMISIRGDVVPLEKLRDYLPINKKKSIRRKTLADEIEVGVIMRKPALVVKEEETLIAFEVDEVVSQQQVVVRQVNANLTNIQIFGGSTILGDGEPGMILNIPEVVKKYSKYVR